MASRDELNRVVGKMMTDHAFRMKFSQDPTKASHDIGINLTPEQSDSFKKNITAFHGAAGELEKGAAQTAQAAGHVIAIFKAPE